MHTTKNFETDKVKNILVVRQHNQLGDMLCSNTLYAALKKKYHGARLTLIASPVNCKMYEGGGFEYIDELIVFEKNKYITLPKFIASLRRRKYDISIVPSTVSFSKTSHYISYLSGAKIRIGASVIDGRINQSAKYLTVKGRFDWKGKNLHQSELILDYARLAGADLSPSERRKVVMKPDKEEMKFARDYVSAIKQDGVPVFAFHPGAGKIRNRWAAENFVELIVRLHRNYGSMNIVTAGGMDIEVSEIVSEGLKKKKIPFTVLGRTHIRKVAAVLLLTDLYVSNDTGTMHVAAAVNAKVIGLFGPTPSFEWGPVNESGRSIQSPSDDINKITVEEVFEESVKLIETGKHR
ncbi:MAG: glycosyltransferase family 9 protein [Bacteroidetes bacterium]|nr:glycosyltransferase family 9 protein [Bacteroidota bacterium]